VAKSPVHLGRVKFLMTVTFLFAIDKLSVSKIICTVNTVGQKKNPAF
jgi:hypothetical protein